MKKNTLFSRLVAISESLDEKGDRIRVLVMDPGCPAPDAVVPLDEAVWLLEDFARQLGEARRLVRPDKEDRLEEELRLKFCRQLGERITKGTKGQPSILSKLKGLKPVKTEGQKKFVALDKVMEVIKLLKPFLLELHEGFISKANEELYAEGELDNVYWHLAEEVELISQDIFREKLIKREEDSGFAFLLLVLFGGLTFILVSLVLIVFFPLLFFVWVALFAVATYFFLKSFKDHCQSA